MEISRAPFAEIAEELEKMSALPIVDRLKYYFHRFMECVEACGIHICRQWTKDVLDPLHVSENKDGQKWAYDVNMLRSILNRAVEGGELAKNTPVDLLTYLLICELYGMMTSWCMSDGKFEPLEWTAVFCDIQLEAVLRPYIEK